MRHLNHTFLALAVIAVLSFTARRIEPGIDLRNPHTVGYWREDIERLRPEFVLIGNSIAGHAFDEHLFSHLADTPSCKLTHTGTATAWWFLALKNIVLPAAHHPRTLAIVFRDKTLTAPTLYARVNSAYIEKVANRSEPLLDRLAYQSALSPLGRFLHRHSALYRLREPTKTTFETTAKKTAARTLGVRPEAVDEAIERVFALGNMQPDLLGDRQEAFEQTATASDARFADLVDASFLPHITALCRQAEIQLVFIRARKRRDLDPDAEPPDVRRYIADLRAWLTARDIPLIDLTREDRITANLYASGDHLNRRRGRDVFTRILAERLSPLLADARPPRPPISEFPRNAGFETWGDFYPNRPCHWRSYFLDDLARAADPTRDGASALELASASGQRTEAYQDIPLPAHASGRRLVFEAEARTDAPDAARLSMMVYDGEWTIIDGPPHPGDGGWHRLRVAQQISSDPGCARVFLKVVFQGAEDGDRAQFDKLRLRIE